MQAPPKTPQRFPIRRDASGLAQTRFCREESDGGLTLTVDHHNYELTPEDTADPRTFAGTWFHLAAKSWFTPEVADDLTLVVTSRWLTQGKRPA